MICLHRFKVKFHPEDGSKRKAELKSNVQNRLAAFQKLLAMGKIDSTPLEIGDSDAIIRLLDAGNIKLPNVQNLCYYISQDRLSYLFFLLSAVILMEGGTEEDVIAMEKQAEQEMANREEGEVDVKPNGLAQSSKPLTTTTTPQSPTSKKVRSKNSSFYLLYAWTTFYFIINHVVIPAFPYIIIRLVIVAYKSSCCYMLSFPVPNKNISVLLNETW